MKKILMALMAVLFLGATSMVFADGTTGSPAPAPKGLKSHKGNKQKGHKGQRKTVPGPAATTK
jgi:hypothetical protein